MNKLRFPIVRVALMAAALALAVVFVGRGAGSPAEATSYNPHSAVTVVDPTPGAHSDLIISFSVDAPDAFPNTTTDSTIQFLPKAWGVHTDAPIGASAGTFNVLTTVGILSAQNCQSGLPLGFDMVNATTDTSKLTSELDVAKGTGPGGADLSPGGLGYSGQFMADPVNPNLRGGVTHYPDFLIQMFPDAGEPLARLFGSASVLDITLISINLVTFDKGALPGYPASMGYPTVTVLLDPVAQPEPFQNDMSHTTCAPLNIINTTFGVTQDNPDTEADESGFPALTNPKSEKGEGSTPHTFTLVTQSDFDADDDNIENWLDTCDVDANTIGGEPGIDDGRQLFGASAGDSDLDELGRPRGDGLNEACDPDPSKSTRHPSAGFYDQDGDLYSNPSDNCPLIKNGWDTWIDVSFAPTGFGSEVFWWLVVEDPIGPGGPIDFAGVQADIDHDRIGDACEGAEHGDQCDNADDDDGDGFVNDGCPTDPGEFVSESGTECDNAEDDDGDGFVNDGCPAQPNAESGAECLNDIDDDGDGLINDGCPWVNGDPETDDQCLNEVDDDGDGLVNDGCPGVPDNRWINRERNWMCNNAEDDDGDGVVNDGCPVNGSGSEGWRDCDNDIDDDGDGVINDGCQQFPRQDRENEYQGQCDNDIDDDFDGAVNDGCPEVEIPGSPETGDQCLNEVDDDDDGLVNDGCPAVDPGDVAKTTPTGHFHQVILERTVIIDRHGVKLDDLEGKDSVGSGGSAVYKVRVENKESDDGQDAPTGLRVLGGCGTVNGVGSQDSTTLSLPADGTAKANFTVDWSGCPDGEYTVQADTCHAGDPAPAGLFASGACPGSDPHGKTDTNPLDDAPRSKIVTVGSP